MKNHNLLFWVACSLLLTSGCRPNSEQPYRQWQNYHGDPGGSHYSELRQINKENIGRLQPKWIYRSGDASSGKRSTIQCNPILVKGKLFILTPTLKLVALEALTGVPIWTFDPFDGAATGGNSRGVSYWTDGKEESLFYVAGSFLFALDPKTGEVRPTFGQAGKVNLQEGLGTQGLGKHVTVTTPGVVFKDLLILGSRVGEGPAPSAPGHIRAYHVRTGALLWTFKTIPDPGEFGSDTWSEDQLDQVGGANVWGGFTLDEEREMVFCGTGSAAYDHWGGNRIGQNLFANCILALDANTGQRAWHYQVVHHDIWDYDLPCPPNLVQVEKEGRLIDAVAQPTKMGHLFVLDRDSGEPIFPVEEMPVPASKIPGEASWPTQPFPPEGLRYAQQSFHQSDITDLSPEAHQYVAEMLDSFTLGSIFLPPGQQPTITLPQYNGGSEWGGAAYDPRHRMLYLNCSNEAEWISMVPAKPKKQISRHDLGQQLYGSICNSCHGQQSPQQLTLPGINHLQEAVHTRVREEIIAIIRGGKGQMPAFAMLSELEIESILSFLKDEGKDEMLKTGELDLSFSDDIPWVATGHRELKDPEGFPANKPPWGTLTAIDLDHGRIKWQVPLGTYPALEKRGFPPTGTFNIGGPLVTAGGLIFIAATMDERFRAFDRDSGEVLWEFQLDAGGYASPATFEIDGQQFVVIAAGGGGKPGTKSGDSYYCFGL